MVTRGNKTFWAGSHRLLKDFGAGISDLLKGMVEDYEKSGKSLVYFGEGNTLLAVIAISDKIKDTSRQAVKQLKESGKYIVLLTGDGHLTAQNVAGELMRIVLFRMLCRSIRRMLLKNYKLKEES